MDYKIYCYLRLNETEFVERKCRRKIEAFLKSNNILAEDFIEEVISGNILAKNRRKLMWLVQELRNDDILIVLRLLDLGRYYSDTIETIKELNKKGVRICILDVKGLNNWFYIINDNVYQIMIDLLIDMMMLLVADEKKIVTEYKIGDDKINRPREKIGRPKTVVPKAFKNKYKAYIHGMYGGITLGDFCKLLGISRTCYYKYKRMLEENGEM